MNNKIVISLESDFLDPTGISRRPAVTDWSWTLTRHEYPIGDVDATARKACRHFRIDPDSVVPALVAAIMMSDGRGFSPTVDAREMVSVESIEDAVDRFVDTLPEGDALARRVNKTLDREAGKMRTYGRPVMAEL